MTVETEPRTQEAKPAWLDFQHTGPDTLAGRFMRMFWQPACRSQDLPPKRAVLWTMMNEKFTLYRGESGAAHAVALRCAHRGTQLSTGWVEGDCIRCRFHGWMYAGDGQCVDQPVERDPFSSRVRIRGYPVQEYLGLIFVYLGEGEPPQLPRFEEFENPDNVVEAVPPKLCESNYFRRVELIGDEGHHMFGHYWRLEGKNEKPVLDAYESDWGTTHTAQRSNGRKMNHYIVPNIMYDMQEFRPPEQGPRMRIMWKVPADDEHYWNLGVLMLDLHGEAAERYRATQARREETVEHADTVGVLKRIMASEITLEDVEDRADISHLEDEVMLVGIGSPDDDPFTEQLGPSDACVIAKRKVWERELRALAEGQPLKKWTWPGKAPASLRFDS